MNIKYDLKADIQKRERELTVQLLSTTPQETFNPIRAWGAESARTFFRWLFLHEKRGLEVPNFVIFPNSL